MSPWIVALMFSVGASTWIYIKLQKYSGNNTKQSVIAAAAAGVLIFFLFYSVLTLIF